MGSNKGGYAVGGVRGVLWIGLLLIWGQLGQGVRFVGVSGYVLPDTSAVQVEFTLEGIANDGLYGSADQYFRHLNIYLVDASSPGHPILAKVTSGENSQFETDFSWSEEISVARSVGRKNGTSNLEFKIRIRETFATSGGDTLANVTSTHNGLRFQLEALDRSGNSLYKDTNTWLVPILRGRPVAAPRSVDWSPIHEGVRVVWDHGIREEYSAASDATPVQLVPPAVVAFALDISYGRADVPAHIIDLEAGNDTATSCVVRYVDAETGCVEDCPDAGQNDKLYFDSSQLPEGLQAQTFDNSSSGEGLGRLTNLASDREYAVFLQYQGGQTRSSCVLVRPLVTISLSERNGEKNQPFDPRCFVATAVWGPDTPQLESLRWFRDHILLHLPGGPSLIEAYYRWSPRLLPALAASVWLRGFFALLLYPLVASIVLLRSPALTLGCLGVTALLLRRFRRRRCLQPLAEQV